MELPPILPPADTPSNAAAMDTPESKKRSRQPRNSACSACAGLKMKCVRNVEGGICERCNRMGVECLPSVPKPRKRREGEFIASHGSLSLQADDANTTPIRNAKALPSPIAKSSATPGAGNAPGGSLLPGGNLNDLHHTGSKSFTALLSRGLGLDRLQPPTSELLTAIDSNSLSNACTVFRQYSASFPFASIPLRIDTVTMVSQRPMTALAVHTVTAAADGERQERLSHAFRLALAGKATVEGERSVDILAGLLIYLAWNHHYMPRQQIYQHLCLLAGMTADLGLYNDPPREDVKDPSVAAELDRCFVGAYYLCALVPSFAFNKHSPMRWTDNLRVCADNLVRAGELHTDRSQASLLELAVAVDDLQTVLQTNSKPSTSQLRSEIQAKAAGQRLRALKRDHAPLANNSILAACLVDAQYMQIYYNDSPDPSTMIQCACSAKEYFDDLLSRAPAFFHQLAIVDWTLILRVAVLMSRLSKQAAVATGWEHGALTSMLQPAETMEKLLSHIASAPANDPLVPKHHGLLHWIHNFVQNMKNILLASDAGAGAGQMDGSDGRFRPMNSEAVSLANRQLPSREQERATRAHSFGVLDHDFWRHLANV